MSWRLILGPENSVSRIVVSVLNFSFNFGVMESQGGFLNPWAVHIMRYAFSKHCSVEWKETKVDTEQLCFLHKLGRLKRCREREHGIYSWTGFPGDSEHQESACNAGDPGSIPGLRRCPGEGNGYPLWHSCLENSMVQRSLVGCGVPGPWGCKELDTTEWLSL